MNDKAPGTRPRRPRKTDEESILSAAAEILERRLQRQGQITDPVQAAEFLKARVAHLDREVFGIVFLDTRHRILAIDHLFEGTIDTCEVHPREVVRRSMGHNAAGPHPVPQPSLGRARAQCCRSRVDEAAQAGLGTPGCSGA